MRKKNLGAIAIKRFALLVVLATAYQAMAQDATTAYPNMAPIEQYLMDRTAEIALARSAAPESISRDAEIPHPTLSFGIRKCGPRSVLMRQPRVPTFYATSKGPT